METAAIEAEIAELSRRIEEKRKVLESSHGIVEERELVASAVKEKIAELTPSGAPATTSAVQPTSLPTTNLPASPQRASYLDTIGPGAIERLNVLLQMAVDHGLKKALKALETEEPFLVDAFHDAIADRYYEELKRHGVL